MNRHLLKLGLGFLMAGSVVTILSSSAYAGYSKCRNSQKYCFKQGDAGPLVKSLVKDLRKAGYYQGSDTDYFDSTVRYAVERFQADHRRLLNGGIGNYPILAVDGVVGKETIRRLCQRVYRGCGPDASCYRGSVELLIPCWKKYGYF
jgi:peptidoglycan hydrolase-like protein with peptidoglycan-binding domain